MRDYYLEYISNHRKNRDGLKAQGAKGTEESFAPFAPGVDCESSRITHAEDPGFELETEEEQSIIFEERLAIMMFDGGLREYEATEYLQTAGKNERFLRRPVLRNF